VGSGIVVFEDFVSLGFKAMGGNSPPSGGVGGGFAPGLGLPRLATEGLLLFSVVYMFLWAFKLASQVSLMKK